MYYIPAGILAKADPLFVEKALELGASQQAIDALGWGSMFSANLLPVTLGNILGGAGWRTGSPTAGRREVRVRVRGFRGAR